MKKFDDKSIEQFYDAILTLKDKKECKEFFEDVCTIKELMDLSQRLQTAIMLKDGRNYQEISTQTGVSSATISRVNRCYEYGAGGYQRVIERLNINKEEER